MDAIIGASLRLFKALPVDAHTKNSFDAYLAGQTLPLGLVFAPDVSAHYPADILVRLPNQLYGRNPQELNSSFHKSFAKVRDSSIEQLVFEQILHYLTTYGAETLGVYDEASVFIPGENLSAPALEEGVRLVLIRGLTAPELKVELLVLLSGAALAEQTIDDAVTVATHVGVTVDDLAQIRNKEVAAALYDRLGVVPSHPEEFLRYLVFKATGRTLLIKSRGVVHALAERDNSDLAPLLAKADLAKLAQIFYRYKPLFLALRTNTSLLRPVINRIRKLALTHHRPMPVDYLNTVTAQVARGTLSLRELEDALESAPTLRKTRLAYALKFRAGEPESIMYRIRNGKAWAAEFTQSPGDLVATAYGLVLDSIVDDLRPAVSGKSVFIPEGLHYALPATEKQFIGNLPAGTYVEATDNFVVGVYWEDLPGSRIDLDLSMTSADGKIGWNGAYRDDQNGIYFSGDMTSAPRGATEAFHIGAKARGSWLIHVNFYNHWGNSEVPMKIIAGHDERRNIGANYIIDPNKILALTNSTVQTQKTVGVLVSDKTSTRFYFAETQLSRGRAASVNNAAEHARRYLVDYYTNAVSLNSALASAGAVFVDNPNDADLDLSWEAVDRTSLLRLLQTQSQLVKA